MSSTKAVYSRCISIRKIKIFSENQDMQHRAGGIFHLSFELALLVKAFDAFVEILCGVLLIFLNPSAANQFIVQLTREELSEDPNDIIANALIHFGQSFSISAQHFGIFYLLSHGILKIILVYLLWRKKLWAYPAAIVLLFVFVVYQVYKIALTASLMMMLLTLLDVVVIALTFIEYRNQKLHKQKNEGSLM